MVILNASRTLSEQLIACSPIRRFNTRMPALTGRRSLDAREECWIIFHATSGVGTIAKRIGIPRDWRRNPERGSVLPGALTFRNGRLRPLGRLPNSP